MVTKKWVVKLLLNFFLRNLIICYFGFGSYSKNDFHLAPPPNVS